VPSVPPAGVSPLSAFLLDTAGVPNGAVAAIMADAIDVATGEYLSIERGFDPTDAAFLTCARTVRGSGSAVESVGQNFADHPRVDPQLEPFMREEVRLMAKELVDAGDLAIQTVTVTPLGDSAETYIEWKNLARDKAQSVRLPPSLLVGAAPQ
jgi:hypothetical protein